MALKFLNKKGWHTGSLRNIENVWKAEQKHDAEQRKLEELRKQIQDERERAEFRQLQEQAGLVPRQERLDFLYESGLAVGKGSSEVFKALQGPPGAAEASASSAAAAGAAGGASSSKAAVPGALFEDKPQSANDAWRKLHTDPLLLIRKKEQDALSRIKSNPVQMAMIRKSVEAEKKQKEQDRKEKRHKKKHRHSKSKHSRHSRRSDSSDEGSGKETVRRKRERSPSERLMERQQRDKQILDADHRSNGKLQASKDTRKHTYEDSEETMKKERAHSPSERHMEHEQRDRRSLDSRHSSKGKSHESEDMRRHNYHNSEEAMRRKRELSPSLHHAEHEKHGKHSEHNRGSGSTRQETNDKRPGSSAYQRPGYNNRRMAPKLSQEEREARLREMEQDAELHEEQRWKRLKKASEREAEEAEKDTTTGGRNFLDAAQKSIYGTAKGGSSTIEESVRRRTFYSQGGSAAEEKNAFRR